MVNIPLRACWDALSPGCLIADPPIEKAVNGVRSPARRVQDGGEQRKKRSLAPGATAGSLSNAVTSQQSWPCTDAPPVSRSSRRIPLIASTQWTPPFPHPQPECTRRRQSLVDYSCGKRERPTPRRQTVGFFSGDVKLNMALSAACALG
jgi:hypothetical protein